MYNSFFGFREKPFKLVPNPDFLFLSKSHEIALAHLSYATDQGDGFVVITGEVGTGKTTLCRIFLERLDKKVESAYIFNPKLDSVQLLTAICNEFGIRTNLKTVKDLLDVINGYLIMKNKAGSKVILLIDEAQNLTVENLEMIRMLSNLETTRSKLLQIILVGQPELGDKLDSFELRQLAQRISLSCLLAPLNARETEAYIQHRINIAAQRQLPIFTSAACRTIHRYANGIPRLINIACDRALLAAYSSNRHKVTMGSAHRVIRELSAQRHAKTGNSGSHKYVLAFLILAVCIFIGIAGYLFYQQKLTATRVQEPDRNAGQHSLPETAGTGSGTIDQSVQTFKIPQPPKKLADFRLPEDSSDTLQTEMRVTQEPSSSSIAVNFAKILDSLDPPSSRMQAASSLLTVWQQPQPNTALIPATTSDQEFFEMAARQYGLRLLAVRQDWNTVKKLNIPFIVALNKPGSLLPVYLTVVSCQDDRFKLTDGGGKNLITIDFNQLNPHLEGQFFIFWRNIFGFDATASLGSDHHAIQGVKELLRKIGYDKVGNAPYFDQFTRDAVIDFQGRHNLIRDGLVGPLTKIFLIMESKAYNYPVLNRENETGI